MSDRQRLLVGVDGGRGGERALDAAARLASRLDLDIVVGHVRPGAPRSVTGECAQRYQEDLEIEVMLQASAALDGSGLAWRFEVVDGDPAHGLDELGERFDVALLVIGTSGAGARPALRRLVSGSVSAHLVHHERRPVLVVPAPKAVAAPA